ncbi:unnamed protein product, partial [Scytosiphon promiscuus]
MSSPASASPLPATPDSNQPLGHGGGRGDSTSASPMPPPPPFNTPSGATGQSNNSVAGSSADVGDGAVPGAALADMLSGISIAENKGTAIPVSKSLEWGRGVGADNEVELPPEVMKRLYQLKALQSEKDVVYEKYKERRAALEMEFAKEYGAIYERRAEVVAGRARDMDDGESQHSSAEFWGTCRKIVGVKGEQGTPERKMHCMLHHEALHDVVCEPDLEALYYLSDVRCVDKPDLLGFTLEFHFDDNPYFSNAVLTKRYDTANIMDQGEPLLEGVEGTPIDWKSGRNLCEKTIRRKVKRGGQSRTITKTEKTESFFKFFQNPVMYDDEEEEEDEELYNFSFDMDYEVARIFRNHLIPNAVLWFTGEAISDDDEDDEETDEEEGVEEAEEASDEEGAMVVDGDDGDEEGAAGGGGSGGPVKTLSFQAPAGFEAPPS